MKAIDAACKDNPIVVHAIKPTTLKSVSWLGNSLALKQLKARVSRVAISSYPILISGEAGTGKSLVVQELAKQWKLEKIIEIDCLYCSGKGFSEQIKSLLINGDSVVLYFRQIELLELRELQLLVEYWRRSIGAQVQGQSYEAGPRIVASSRINTETGAQNQGTVFKEACHTLDTLKALSIEIKTPSLKERRQDIPRLIDHVIEKKGENTHFHLSSGKIESLASRDWLENVKGLWCFIENLQIQSELKRKPFSLNSGAASNKPWDGGASSSTNVINLRNSDMRDKDNENSDRELVELVEVFSINIEAMPLSIQRALNFIQRHFRLKIKISDVAEQACISAPHLSYLLKKHVGISFKQILIGLRMKEACQLLCLQPRMSVTDVCAEVGYTDLSNFEKAFKKANGVSPGQFRRNAQFTPFDTQAAMRVY